jgi:Aspartyl protease
MPCIATQFDPRVGPLIQIAILPPQPTLVAGHQATAGQSLHLFMALVDTGASCTCISSKVVADVGLQPTGKMPMAGVHGSTPTNTYQFAVGFLTGQRQVPSGAITANVHLIAVNGAEFNNAGCGFDILLGRDVICQGTLFLSFHGQMVITF